MSIKASELLDILNSNPTTGEIAVILAMVVSVLSDEQKGAFLEVQKILAAAVEKEKAESATSLDNLLSSERAGPESGGVAEHERLKQEFRDKWREKRDSA